MDPESLKAPGPFPPLIPFAFPGLPGVRCLFGTALTGNLSLDTAGDPAQADAVRAARRRLFQDCGLSAWAELRQTHGDVFLLDPEPTDPETLPAREADGQCTQRAGLGLLIKTADCQPLLLASAAGTAIAALHVGWRGNVRNFPAKGVAAFCRACGISPAEVLAARGPSLGPGAAEFIHFGQEWGPSFLPWFDPERRTMDLWSLTRSQLTEAGIPPGNIFSLDLCTRSLPGLFFSHRRRDSGRQISLIWREEEKDAAGRRAGVAIGEKAPVAAELLRV
ncbi:MAG: polyphenol oxidase family protein [Desulfovibrio sp.]|jgi:YfiH family protein|nr:polyphenol oxidase family protein [Desulfovibrio sp.]